VKDRVDLDKEPIVTMGHTPLEKAGKPSMLNRSGFISRNDFIQRMFHMHYNRWYATRSGYKNGVESKIEGTILSSLPVDLFDNSNQESIEEVIEAFEAWYWQERTPKYLLRSQEADRVGLYNRWFPLWDREISESVAQIKYTERANRGFIKRYLNWLDQEVRGSNADSYKITSKKQTPTISDQVEKIVNQIPRDITEPFVRYYKFRKSQQKYPYIDDKRYSIISQTDFEEIGLKYQHPKTLWFYLLYRDGYLEFATETELDRACL